MNIQNSKKGKIKIQKHSTKIGTMEGNIDIANYFNKYLIDLPDKLRESFDETTGMIISVNKIMPTIFLNNVSKRGVLNITLDFEGTPSSDIDNITFSMLKKETKFLFEPVAFLINKSLNQADFPKC